MGVNATEPPFYSAIRLPIRRHFHGMRTSHKSGGNEGHQQYVGKRPFGLTYVSPTGLNGLEARSILYAKIHRPMIKVR